MSEPAHTQEPSGRPPRCVRTVWLFFCVFAACFWTMVLWVPLGAYYAQGYTRLGDHALMVAAGLAAAGNVLGAFFVLRRRRLVRDRTVGNAIAGAFTCTLLLPAIAVFLSLIFG